MAAFHEFPKAIYLAEGGNPVIVHDADHEARVMASTKDAEPASDKEALLAKATDLGIEVDRRWGSARLRAEIEAKSG